MKCPSKLMWELCLRRCLPEAERAELDAHLDSCERCSTTAAAVADRFRRARRVLTVAVLLAIAGIALITAADVYLSRLTGDYPVTTIFGPSSPAPGAKALFAVAVRSARDCRPLADAEVALSLKFGEREYPVGKGRTADHGFVLFDCTVPPTLHGQVQLVSQWPTGLFGTGRAALPMRVQPQTEIRVSTDRPLYQPGQVIHIRAVVTDLIASTPMVDQDVTIEIRDGKGHTVLRQKSKTSLFGIAALDFQLATEVNEGDYAITASAGSGLARRRVRVERYQLPELKVSVEPGSPPREGDEPLGVTVRSEYFFGKPVAHGEVKLALHAGDRSEEFVGRTDEKGEHMFEIPLSGKHFEAGRLVLEAHTRARCGAQATGYATVPLGKDYCPGPVAGTQAPHPPKASHAIATDKSVYDKGETVKVIAEAPDGTALLEVSEEGVPLLHRLLRLRGGQATTEVALAETWTGSIAFRLWRLTGSGRPQACMKTIYVRPDRLAVAARLAKASYRPGEEAKLTITTSDSAGQPTPAAIGLSITDAALLRLAGAMHLPVTLRHRDVALGGGSLVQSNAVEQRERMAKVRSDFTRWAWAPLWICIVVLLAVASLWSIVRVRLLARALRAEGRTELTKHASANAQFGTAYLLQFWSLVLGLLLAAVAGPLLGYRWLNADWFFRHDKRIVLIWTGYLIVAVLAGQAWRHRLRMTWLGALWLVIGLVGFSLVRMPSYLWEQQVGLMLVSGSFFVGAAYSLRMAGGERARGLAHGEHRGELSPRSVLVACFLAISAIALLDGMARKRFGIELIVAGSIVYVIPLLCLRRMAGTPRGGAAVRPPGLSRSILPVSAGLAMMFVLAVMLLPALGRLRAAARIPASPFGGTYELPAGCAASVRRGARATATDPRLRREFPETLLWNPEIITDEAGRAEVSIPLADSITTWHASLDAIGRAGRLGSGSLEFRTWQPFFVDMSLPARLTVGDAIEVPIRVMNYLASAQNVVVSLQPGDWYELDGEAEQSLVVKREDEAGLVFRVRATRAGSHELAVQAQSAEASDAVARSIEVLPRATLHEEAVNGWLLGTTTHEIQIPTDAIDPRLVVRLYPSAVGEVIQGIEGLLRVPSGCLEQTLSSTYPNILVLRYLRERRMTGRALERKALDGAVQGYQRLLTFQRRAGGFGWYARHPGDPVLSAYVVLVLRELRGLHRVDDDVVTRAVCFLESTQGADGSWRARSPGPLVETAYITWALAEARVRSVAVDRGLQYLISHLDQTDDAYSIALAANAFLRARREQTGQRLVECLASQARAEDERVWWVSGSQGATFSTGPSHDLETTALATLALLRGERHAELAAGALRYLRSQRDADGGFGTTQSTALALKALLAGSSKKPTTALSVSLNGELKAQMVIQPRDADLMRRIAIDGLRPGPNSLAISDLEGSGIPYQALVRFYAPDSPEGGGIEVQCTPDQGELSAGERHGYELRLRLTGDDPMPMVVAEGELPPGFLLSRVEQSAILDRHEVVSGKLIFYLKGLEKGKEGRLRFCLRARYRGMFTMRPFVAYAYYCPEVRGYSRPLRLRVR